LRYIIAIFIYLLVISNSYSATEDLDTVLNDPNSKETLDLGKFGFGPAFFVLAYDDEILSDSKDVKVRGDGAIDASGSKYGTSLGLEVHYDFSIWGTRYGYKQDDGKTNWTKSNGFVLSPYIGVYDIDNGIKGLSVGLVLGYWKGDKNFGDRTSLNFGIGYTVHRDQLVLASGVEEGKAPPAGLATADYTTRKDVTGISLLVSVSVDF